jgi:hypothetical protein
MHETNAKNPIAAPPKRGRWFINSLKLATGLVVGLGIAEGAFRFRDHAAFPHVNFYVADSELGTRLQPGATERISFSGNPVTSVRINSLGYRGGEWPAPAANEVVVVGDSQVFGLGVEEHETFSAVLSNTLPGKPFVRNLGVPTYGPREYTAVLGETLAKRPAALVVYVVNMANDLFEAKRPNKDRHAVWDGWAVRKEHAPASMTAFPGRNWLFRESHAMFALRGAAYQRGVKDNAAGAPSEH